VADAADRLKRELHPERGAVDWRPVERRRRAAAARVEAVERYARTSGCRRAALLAYFGERVGDCSGCDRCRGRDVPVLIDREAVRRLARLRRTIARAHSPWPGGLLDDATLARLAARPPGTVEELAAIPGVGVPVASRYGALLIAGLSPATRKAEPDPLLAALLGWRARTASALGIPPIELASERALRAIAAARPADVAGVAKAGGFGPRMRAKFGGEVAELVRAFGAPPNCPAGIGAGAG
jgi:ATP-dependent DNA helicase RecQ